METPSAKIVLATIAILAASSCRTSRVEQTPPPTGSGTLPRRVTEPAPPLRASSVPRPGSSKVSVDSAKEAGSSESPATGEETPAQALSKDALRKEADRVLDDWHGAAAAADRKRYLSHFALDAVFLGTDAAERWDLAAFTAYVDVHFPRGGWTFTPLKRYVMFGPSEEVAWFDEQLLSDSYGDVRGSGALRRDGDTWRIVHYNMAFTIPNDVQPGVTDLVEKYKAEIAAGAR